jgi:hypothetical protein
VLACREPFLGLIDSGASHSIMNHAAAKALTKAASVQIARKEGTGRWDPFFAFLFCIQDCFFLFVKVILGQKRRQQLNQFQQQKYQFAGAVCLHQPFSSLKGRHLIQKIHISDKAVLWAGLSPQ